MIKTRMGTTELKGDYATIMADYTMITRSMFDFLTNRIDMTEEEAKDKLIEAFESGIQHKKEIPVLNVIADILGKVIEKLDKDEESEEPEEDADDEELKKKGGAIIIEVQSPEEVHEMLHKVMSKEGEK